MAVEITLANGSKYLIKRAQFVGEIIDTNGQRTGGFTTFVFEESELNAIASGLNIQGVYDAFMLAKSSGAQKSEKE